jgi:hypothetical protein
LDGKERRELVLFKKVVNELEKNKKIRESGEIVAIP